MRIWKIKEVRVILWWFQSSLNSENSVTGGSNVSSVNSEDSFQYFIDQIETIYRAKIVKRVLSPSVGWWEEDPESVDRIWLQVHLGRARPPSEMRWPTHPTAHIGLDQPPLVPDVEALLPQMTHPTLDLINPQWHLLSQKRPPSTTIHQDDQED